MTPEQQEAAAERRCIMEAEGVSEEDIRAVLAAYYDWTLGCLKPPEGGKSDASSD
jgi:hypothetical protein